jgi:hypothetical protein
MEMGLNELATKLQQVIEAHTNKIERVEELVALTINSKTHGNKFIDAVEYEFGGNVGLAKRLAEIVKEDRAAQRVSGTLSQAGRCERYLREHSRNR